MTIAISPILAALEFGSLSMLGWLAVAALPWLIHRWRRRQHRTTSWAAIDLLLIAVGERSRRVRFQQWLLIAVRTAILALVALAAAEPALRQWSLAAGESGRTHMVLVIDQSYSMSCTRQGLSRLDRAKAQATQLVESRYSGDTISIIGWSQQADDLLGRPTGDVSLALTAIEGLEQSQSKASFTAAVRAVFSTIDRAESESSQSAEHQVVFISDLGRNTWQEALTEESSLARLANRARITVVDVGDATRENLAITDLSIDPPLVLRQQEVVVSATLRSFGDQAWDEMTIGFTVDGRQIDSRIIDLPTDGEVAVQFPYRFIDEGQHTIMVFVAGETDDLPIDNQRWLIVDVKPQLRVACLAGKPQAADDVARALSPGGASANDPISAEVLPMSSLADLDLTEFDAALLCNPIDLNPREASQLARFVRRGGGLAVLVGEQTAESRLEQLNLKDADGDLLPVVIGERVGIGDYRFDALDYQHPIVAPFRGQESSGLLSVAIQEYQRLDLKKSHPFAETALQFDTGDPALVVDRYGMGRMAVLAIPASLSSRTAEGTPWSSFPVSPSFLPIIRELVAHLVGDRWLEGRNLLVGQPATCRWDASRQAATIEVQRPDGGSQVIPLPGAEDQGQIIWLDTATSGVYKLIADAEPFARFAVNLDTRESDLATVDIAALPASISATSLNASSAFSAASIELSFVRSLLVAAALLMLLEVAVAWWLGRGWQ